jgi:N-methylhydantoinase A/acetophenone carboxylase
VPGALRYQRNGTEPTVTDAKLLLGHIDSDNYAGFPGDLNHDKGAHTIVERVAADLKVSAEEAATRIVEAMERRIGDSVREILSAKGYEPKNFDLYVIGGAGPSSCCNLLDRIGARRAILFPFGSAFSAFGALNMDIVYEYRVPVVAQDELEAVVESMKRTAARDMRLEGAREGDVTFRLNLVVQDADGSETLSQAASMDVKKEMRKISDEVTAIMLEAVVPAGKIALHTYKASGGLAAARKKTRKVYWGKEFDSTDVYAYQDLVSGNTIHGPAVIEVEGTSVMLKKGYDLTVDAYRNGIVQHTT